MGKRPQGVRYAAARLLAELELGRTLTREEVARVTSKVNNSFPRNSRGPGYLYTAEPAASNKESGIELYKILDRAKILRRPQEALHGKS